MLVTEQDCHKAWWQSNLKPFQTVLSYNIHQNFKAVYRFSPGKFIPWWIYTEDIIRAKIKDLCAQDIGCGNIYDSQTQWNAQ